MMRTGNPSAGAIERKVFDFKMKGALAIFRFLVETAERGERAVLVTLTDVVGGAARSPGTHMAVSESGASIGSFSGGCIEAAVTGEALATLANGRARRVRFGAGSPYIDIRLPCGGGIDLLFTPTPPANAMRQALQRLEARETVGLLLSDKGACDVTADSATGWTPHGFAAYHKPAPGLLIAGHGEEVLSLARLAFASTMPVTVHSPDEETLQRAAEIGAKTNRLISTDADAGFIIDPFTAVIFLFHDHDWEEALLPAAIASPAFFMGAMGSQATHERRKAMLRDRGISPADIARVTGPVGLLPRSRDPETLAISILSQVVQVAEDSVKSQPTLEPAPR